MTPPPELIAECCAEAEKRNGFHAGHAPVVAELADQWGAEQARDEAHKQQAQAQQTAEAERLAEVFETFAKDHKPDGWPAVQQHFLSEAASVLRLKAAETERLKSTPPAYREELHCVIADLTRQCQESDALLRQALEAMQWEAGGEPLHTLIVESITAIKQHLREV